MVRLSGTVSNFRKTRARARFVFTQLDSHAASTVALAPGADDRGREAALLSARAAVEEDADYLEFDLDDHPVKGWVWRSPFSEGDRVEVAAAWQGDHYEAYGIARPRDRAVALYPFCCRGTASLMQAALRWWALFGVAATWGSVAALFIAALLLSTSLTSASSSLPGTVLVACLALACAVSAFLALLAYSLARRWSPFARTAEHVFATFGWREPSRIDLVKTTRERRSTADPAALGTFYFRY
ncbi:hypothetical protein OOT46_19200 [Aquabacterium sp. A7-Y]|uniref:putative type VI secretion system effector n=1 Tax=Aquabacterium sp. A7-Y TaxID=1349605 RepID=UPI00223E52D9|nr:putative type VI secretion system effector [Aquabacterium sp. A7-Y]MCW7539967.1 hypothetical protein [Aquabacterium sp. A7-Y]